MDRASQVIQGDSETPAAGGLTSNRVKFILGATVLVAAMGYFAFQAFQSASMYYLTVSELQQRGPTQEGRMVRVNGKLVSGSFVRQPDSTLANFSIPDGAQTMGAVHDGVVPDLFFNEHSEVTLVGTYTAGGVFESHNVIVKCPSKYIAVQ